MVAELKKWKIACPPSDYDLVFPLDQRENPKYIQTQQGFASTTMTMDIYGHLFKQINAQAASKLGRAVFGDKKI
jgi:hypothetical protein